jgi:DHA2 family multidrug resistance protein
LTESHPVVDLRLIAGRSLWTSSLALSLAYGGFLCTVVVLRLWLRPYRGYTATQAGMILAPVGLLAILLTPLVGRTVHKVDPRLFATGAFLIFALVFYMRSKFNTSADVWTLMVPTIIQGAAVAIFFIPLVTLSLSGLSPDRIPSASGLFNFARITAGSFGTSITTTLWDHRATLHHAQIAEQLTGDGPSRQALAGLQASGLTPDQSYALLNRLVDQQAFMLSANDLFYASALLFLLLIAILWLARPTNGAAGAREAAAGAH